MLGTLDATSDQPTMAQRIKDRRAKLEASLQAKRMGNRGDQTKTEEHDTVSASKGEEQVRASRKELANLKSSAAAAVSQFRVTTNAAENERRIREESLQATRAQRTVDESATSQRRHASIQMKFDSLYQIDVPQELMMEMELQREACRKVIDVKDKLIGELRLQLREKEEEYVKALKQQAEDVDRLIETMHQQTESLVTAYQRELTSIEEAYTSERKELLEKYAGEIDALIAQRTKKEADFNAKREARVWEDQRVLDDKYEEYAEKFNKCKTDNLHEIHGLAQELERMRALYLLNAERLHYNLQVLRERVQENGKAIAQHKRKLARLQDVLSSLITKYAETDKRFRQTNNELTESYRRVTEQYKDLQLKFQHFEQADAEKFKQVWKMHENECMALVHKCLQADRVIFENLLGVSWAAPPLDFWVQAQQASAAQLMEDNEELEQEQIELSDMAHAMLLMVYEHAGFLIDERTRASIRTADPGEQNAMKVDVVLASLNLTTTDDVNMMLEHFVVNSDDGSSSALVHQQEVIQALQRFQTEQNERKRAAQSADTPAVATQKPDELKQQDAQKRIAKDFWKRLAKVIPEGHLRIWTSLETGLQKYLTQLQLRSTLIEDTDAIRKQNDELRALLNQYLSSKLNEELFAPPQLQIAPGPAGGSSSVPYA